MKKTSIIVTFLLVAAMVLAACSNSDTNNNDGTVGTTVPTMGAGNGLGETTTPESGLSTSTAETGTGGSMNTTPTAQAGSSQNTTPTANAGTGGNLGTTPTAEAGTGSAGQTSTPAAGTGVIPQTGTMQQFVLLSNLLKMQVQAQDGSQIGNVAGVLINRGMGATSSTITANQLNSDLTATPGALDQTSTPVAGTDNGSQTSTPAAGEGANQTATPMVSSGNANGTTGSASENPQVTYVLVNMTGNANSGSNSNANNNSNNNSSNNSGAANGQGNQVLVPFQAFQISSTASMGMSTSNNSNSSSQAGSANSATPTAGANSSNTGNTGATGSAGSNTGLVSSDAVLVLNVDASVLADAPAFDENTFQGQVNSDINQYWANQGTGIAVTGNAATSSNNVLVRGQIGSLNITDDQGKTLGQVRDFIVDTQTGEILYAVLSGGSTFGGNYYVVPMTAMTWQAGQGQGIDLGTFQSNIPSTNFDNAPHLNSLNDLENNTTWFNETNNYWNSNLHQ